MVYLYDPCAANGKINQRLLLEPKCQRRIIHFPESEENIFGTVILLHSSRTSECKVIDEC